jgi:hypothetical protein
VLTINSKETNMLRSRNYALAGLAVVTWLAAGTARTALAREELRFQQDKIAMGQDEVKQFLPLMADEKGKVSEAAFMKYMQAEFKRLNKDEQGKVDVLEGTDHPSRRPVTFSAVGR